MEITLADDEGWEVPVLAVPLGGGRFRIAETPDFLDSFAFQDEVVGARSATGKWVARAVVRKAGMVTHYSTVPRSFRRSTGMQDFFQEIREAGGDCSIFAGGLLRVDLPARSTMDLPSRLELHSTTKVEEMRLRPRRALPNTPRQSGTVEED